MSISNTFPMVQTILQFAKTEINVIRRKYSGSGIINVETDSLSTKNDIPTKLSQLENDWNYITSSQLDAKKFATASSVSNLDSKVNTNERDAENKFDALNTELDNIKKVLTSNDVDFDTLQELVDALKNNVSSINDIFATMALKATNVDLINHTSNTNNPHAVTKTQVGLSNVRNVESYSKTEADNLLNAKPDRTELFSKNYNDLKNKPTIPTNANEVGAYTKEETNELIQNLLNRIIVLEQKVNENTNTNTTAVVEGSTLTLTNANVENNTLTISGGSVENGTLTI
jgi:hypothetical protein